MKKFSPITEIVEEMKMIFPFVVAGIILLIVMAVVRSCDKKEVAEIKRSNTSVVGEIISVGSMKGSYAIARYKVGDSVYEIKNNSPSRVLPGEYFRIIYKESDPSNARIDFSKPVFMKGAETDTTFASVVYTDFATVGFVYDVNGERIKRFQKLPEGRTVKDGETIKVVYLKNRPKVSILQLE